MYYIPDYAKKAIDILENNGFESYIVGGSVRDFLMGNPPHDFDITTNALPDEIKNCFEDYKLITSGEKHGTVGVVIDGEVVEITTYRIDGSYSDSRHPETVTFSKNLREDLSRRDFTVNAMAINKRGEIVDIFGGRDDIENRIIRTVGNPSDRFDEDALRIMRALRFASVLGFEIEQKTAQQIHEKAGLLKNIAVERIREEFLKLICGVKAVGILREYSDVIEVFIPEIKDMYGFLQHTPFHKYDVWEHTLHAVGNIIPDPCLRMTMLLHDIAKPDCLTIDRNGVGHFKGHALLGAVKARKILNRLRFSNDEIKLITTLIENHRDSYKNDADVKRMLNRVGAERFRQLLLVKRADDGAKGVFFEEDKRRIDFAEKRLAEILENHECYCISQMEINGSDLIEIGVTGRKIGKVLDNLLEKIMYHGLENDKDKLVSCAKEII